MDLEKLLNQEQIKPVTQTEGAVLVLAGAGSGKTRVLTYRVAHLLGELKVPDYNILAITFTNKATKEMMERVKSVVGENNVWISTFHSFCAKVLRYDIDKLGYNSNFSIYTANDSLKLITRILKDFNIDDSDMKQKIKWHISNAKNSGLNPVDYYDILASGGLEDEKAKLIFEIYDRYEKELKRNNALDFDDLLKKTIELFRLHKDVLQKYQDKFMYIHIDEFQDTNKIQMLLVRMLAAKHGNLFVVGDDDQSIYGWRGAEVENILNFKKHYPYCKIFKLQQNYRSTEQILECANKIISNNTHRMGKELWTQGGKGAKVVYKSCYDDKQEADYVLKEISGLVYNNGYKYSDMAILVRANSLTRQFEEKMNFYGIRYKIYGGFKFYDRKEIMDTLAYLRIVSNPLDSEGIGRIINFPKRGIGETAFSKLKDYCDNHNISVYQGIMEIENNGELSSLNIKKFLGFKILLQDLIEKASQMPLDEYVDYLYERVNFAQAFDMEKAEEANKYENIGEFISSVKEFCKDNNDATLDSYLQSVALISDSEDEDFGDYLTVATIHAVKGLEFGVVFVVGCEEGIFPSARTLGNSAELEEERRCMYVAVTRAKERLYLTSANSRYRFGRYENNLVSRFVKESGLIQQPLESESKISAAYSKYMDIGNMPKPKIDSVAKKENVLDKDISQFKIGCIVEHNKYGFGEIISLDGDSASIKFEKLGVKMFALRLAPIKLVK